MRPIQALCSPVSVNHSDPSDAPAMPLNPSQPRGSEAMNTRIAPSAFSRSILGLRPSSPSSATHTAPPALVIASATPRRRVALPAASMRTTCESPATQIAPSGPATMSRTNPSRFRKSCVAPLGLSRVTPRYSSVIHTEPSPASPTCPGNVWRGNRYTVSPGPAGEGGTRAAPCASAATASSSANGTSHRPSARSHLGVARALQKLVNEDIYAPAGGFRST
jgi:hypothetical protein